MWDSVRITVEEGVDVGDGVGGGVMVSVTVDELVAVTEYDLVSLDDVLLTVAEISAE